MANATKGFQHDNKSPIGATRESLWSVITTVETNETHLGSTLPTIGVGDVVHTWSLQNPRSVSTRSAVQGADPSFDNTDTSRAGNVTQIITVAYELTGTRKSAPNAIGGDPMARERKNAMRDWKNSLELALLRGTRVTGNNSTAAQMLGMKGFASTLLTSQSGVSLGETTYNLLMGNGWVQGVNLDTVLVGRVLKSRISGFTSSNTKNIDVEEFKTVNKVDVYEGDYGTQQIKLHRLVTLSGDTNNDFLAYDSEYQHIGEYRGVKMEPLAKTGDAEREQMLGEYTFQVDTEKSILLSAAHL